MAERGEGFTSFHKENLKHDEEGETSLSIHLHFLAVQILQPL